MHKAWRFAASGCRDGRRANDENRADARTWQPAPRAPRLQLISIERGPAVSRVESEALRRFSDERWRGQIAVYLTHRSRAGDERNERSLARWNDGVRQQWEIEHLGPSTRIAALTPLGASSERERSGTPESPERVSPPGDASQRH